jgi:hypothetical protein
MGVRTETVQFHSCDLCGQDTDEAALVRVYSALQSSKRLRVAAPKAALTRLSVPDTTYACLCLA